MDQKVINQEPNKNFSIENTNISLNGNSSVVGCMTIFNKQNLINIVAVHIYY